MRGRLAAVSLLLSLAVPAAAERAAPGVEAASEVGARIKAGDCAGAVGSLNEGLAKNHPEVNLLAGAMFENGVCVKPDWNRAMRLYGKAFDGGQKAALYRLVSGFAAPEHGPDMAAALWWANRNKEQFTNTACQLSDAVAADPDRFVAELRTWAPARLATCNYMLGVWATLIGEIRYPDKAASYSLGGDIRLHFEPAVPRIDIKTANITEYTMAGWVNGNAVADRTFRSSTGSFEDTVRQLADRALKRYPQPAGIPTNASAEMNIHFGD